ncbi:hypothetical protein E2C01_098335 [Portunus trituberculatus]|uniref:Uncharacterized protein n=1 Tax=Portunus trituberculatus TaxID=210409 RepID=A0A5B7K7E7_PORTR|nr:hypothetical protein [Portunus trituberculatus]
MKFGQHGSRGPFCAFHSDQQCMLGSALFIGINNHSNFYQVSLPDHLDTLYWCKIFKMPPTPTKHHMIGVSDDKTYNLDQ